jgi:hypothetical protein
LKIRHRERSDAGVTLGMKATKSDNRARSGSQQHFVRYIGFFEISERLFNELLSGLEQIPRELFVANRNDCGSRHSSHIRVFAMNHHTSAIVRQLDIDDRRLPHVGEELDGAGLALTNRHPEEFRREFRMVL